VFAPALFGRHGRHFSGRELHGLHLAERANRSPSDCVPSCQTGVPSRPSAWHICFARDQSAPYELRRIAAAFGPETRSNRRPGATNRAQLSRKSLGASFNATTTFCFRAVRNDGLPEARGVGEIRTVLQRCKPWSSRPEKVSAVATEQGRGANTPGRGTRAAPSAPSSRAASASSTDQTAPSQNLCQRAAQTLSGTTRGRAWVWSVFSQSTRGEIVGGIGDPKTPDGHSQASSLRFLALYFARAHRHLPQPLVAQIQRQWAGLYDLSSGQFADCRA